MLVKSVQGTIVKRHIWSWNKPEDHLLWLVVFTSLRSGGASRASGKGVTDSLISADGEAKQRGIDT